MTYEVMRCVIYLSAIMSCLILGILNWHDREIASVKYQDTRPSLNDGAWGSTLDVPPVKVYTKREYEGLFKHFKTSEVGVLISQTLPDCFAGWMMKRHCKYFCKCVKNSKTVWASLEKYLKKSLSFKWLVFTYIQCHTGYKWLALHFSVSQDGLLRWVISMRRQKLWATSLDTFRYTESMEFFIDGTWGFKSNLCSNLC